MDKFSVETLKAILEARSALPAFADRSFSGLDVSGNDISRSPVAADSPGNQVSSMYEADPLNGVSSSAIFEEIIDRQRSIYGEDDRVEAHASTDARRRANARSVAAVIKAGDFSPTGTGKFSVSGTTLADRFEIKGTPLCGREPFQDQPSCATGSAFLLTPTIVATAAHCLDVSNFHKFSLVFDFEAREDGSVPRSYSPDQIYAVKRYIGGHFDTEGADWALVELDRRVAGREPLAFRRAGKAEEGSSVYVIGHPSGLPKKIAGNAVIRSNSHPDYFVANLDTYGGNSGSPVFNALTHEVEGLLVRGQSDFTPLGDCVASLVCPMEGCRGEDCTRMGPIAKQLQETELIAKRESNMDHTLYLPPVPSRYTRFELSVRSGELELIDSGLVAIYVQLRSTGDYVPLATGQPLPIESIYPDQLYAVAISNSTGVSTSSFVQTSSVGTVEFKVVTIIGSIMIDCDANRDGIVGFNEEGKANWTWGPDGQGAIVLVDNDRDPLTGGPGILDEREPIEVRDTGITELPDDVSLRLSTDPAGAMKFSVFRKSRHGAKKLLGRAPSEPIQDLLSTSGEIELSGETLYVAAHEYPGPFFEGLFIISLELVHSSAGVEHVLASDRIMMRVAPWIMLPNTQPAKRIFTCELANGLDNNQQFLDELGAAVAQEGLQLEVIPPRIHRGDRWIQDEIEIGYTRSHRGQLPVVFDSPRDRQLDDWPEIGLLGQDFGHFVVGGGVPNSLDSFGNLEVSPPVVVDGRAYPLGRIIVGGRRKGDFSHESRQMMAEVRQFLFAQKVQFPFEVFTDWLDVGHVDEIVCFVPSQTGSGFKVLLASTREVKAILEKLSDSGHGNTSLFEGKTRLDGNTAEITVDDLRRDATFWSVNAVFQDYLDETGEVLKKELGVTDSDIVEIPVCFRTNFVAANSLERTSAFFPNMVNHLVHQDLSIVAKPYGPMINGKCAFETAFEKAVHDRRVIFIDDWYSYHEMLGEVHCGTNAQRSPFRVSRWWQVRPEGGFDIKTSGFMDD